MTLAEMYMNGMVKMAAGPAPAAPGIFRRAAKSVGDRIGTERDMLDVVRGRHAGASKETVDTARQFAGRGLAAGAGGAALLGGGALAMRKLMAKKSLGSRLGGAFKKNRKAIAIGAGAGAAGLAGLAAYKKRQGK